MVIIVNKSHMFRWDEPKGLQAQISILSQLPIEQFHYLEAQNLSTSATKQVVN